MNQMEHLRIGIFQLAQSHGRKYPTLEDVVEIFQKWRVIPEFNVINPNQFIVYGKGVDSPTVTFEFHGNEVKTARWTTPKKELLIFCGVQEFGEETDSLQSDGKCKL